MRILDDVLRTVSQYGVGVPKMVDQSYVQALTWGHGNGRIAGTLSILRPPVEPAARRVVLMEETTMKVLRGMISQKNGEYSFEKLAPIRCVVVGLDQTGVYNGAIASGVYPEGGGQ